MEFGGGQLRATKHAIVSETSEAEKRQEKFPFRLVEGARPCELLEEAVVSTWR